MVLAIGAVAARQPGLGRHHRPAAGRRRLRRDPGRAAVDRRRAGAGRAADRAVPRRLLPPRAAALRADGSRPSRCPLLTLVGLHPGAGRLRAARALAAEQLLVGGGDLAAKCPTRCAPAWRCTVALALLAHVAACCGRAGCAACPGTPRRGCATRRSAPMPPAEADGIVWGESGARRHPVPPLRPRAGGHRRPGGRGERPRFRDLAAARPGAARRGWTRRSGGPGRTC